MDLLIFILAVAATGTVYYFLCCVIYLLLTGRPALAAVAMSWRMMLATILGAPLFGFGGILLATIWFNHALEKMPNYNKWRDIAVGAVLSLAGTYALFFVTLTLAWEIIG